MHFKNPPHWCHVIKDKEGGVLSCNVSVDYHPQTKLLEGIVFTGLCHSVQGGWKVARGDGRLPGEHESLPGGMHGSGEGVHRIRRDTVNERVVHILLQCIVFAVWRRSFRKVIYL